jgi:hypothetical protein
MERDNVGSLMKEKRKENEKRNIRIKFKKKVNKCK